MIRKAVLDDIGGMTDLIKEASVMYPELVFCQKRAEESLRSAMADPSDLVLVCASGNTISGSLVTLTGDFLWANRKTAKVMFFFSKKPGSGEALLRGLLSWVDSRRAIKHLELDVNLAVDDRLDLLLTRMGFTNTDKVYRRFR